MVENVAQREWIRLLRYRAARLLVAGLLIVPSGVRAATTNAFSALVSYEYNQGVSASPLVSYQFNQGVAAAPLVSYVYPSGIGLTATVSFYYYAVADSIGDGITDLWRAQYFGGLGIATNKHSCATCDADGTGQNNLFKYVAGLNPTNPASVFAVNVGDVTNQPPGFDLTFSPVVAGRTYTPWSSPDLVNTDWSPLTTSGGPLTNGNQVTIIDTNALLPNKFYRVNISYP